MHCTASLFSIIGSQQQPGKSNSEQKLGMVSPWKVHAAAAHHAACAGNGSRRLGEPAKPTKLDSAHA